MVVAAAAAYGRAAARRRQCGLGIEGLVSASLVEMTFKKVGGREKTVE